MIDPFTSGKNFGYSILDNKKYLWISRLFFAVIVVCLLIKFLFPSAFSLDYSTYDDLFSSNSNVNTLLSLLPVDNHNYDYVVWQNAEREYIIAYSSELTYENDLIVSGSDVPVNYIRSYYQSSGYQYEQKFEYGTLTNFSLSVNDIVTSNLNFEKSSHSFTYESFSNNRFNYWILLAFIPIILVLLFRKVLKNDLV